MLAADMSQNRDTGDERRLENRAPAGSRTQLEGPIDILEEVRQHSEAEVTGRSGPIVKSTAVICDGDDDEVALSMRFGHGRGCPRVLRDVSETLADHAVDQTYVVRPRVRDTFDVLTAFYDDPIATLMLACFAEQLR